MTNTPCSISSTDTDCSLFNFFNFIFFKILGFPGLDLVAGHWNKGTSVWIGVSNSNCCSAENPSAGGGSSSAGHCLQAGRAGSKRQRTAEIVFIGKCKGVWTNGRTWSTQALKHSKFAVIRNGGCEELWKMNTYISVLGVPFSNFTCYPGGWVAVGRWESCWVLLLPWKSLRGSVRAGEELWDGRG